jgi:hypothetical protein
MFSFAEITKVKKNFDMNICYMAKVAYRPIKSLSFCKAEIFIGYSLPTTSKFYNFWSILFGCKVQFEGIVYNYSKLPKF